MHYTPNVCLHPCDVKTVKWTCLTMYITDMRDVWDCRGLHTIYQYASPSRASLRLQRSDSANWITETTNQYFVAAHSQQTLLELSSSAPDGWLNKAEKFVTPVWKQSKHPDEKKAGKKEMSERGRKKRKKNVSLAYDSPVCEEIQPHFRNTNIPDWSRKVSVTHLVGGHG